MFLSEGAKYLLLPENKNELILFRERHVKKYYKQDPTEIYSQFLCEHKFAENVYPNEEFDKYREAAIKNLTVLEKFYPSENFSIIMPR